MAYYAYKNVRDLLPQHIIDKQGPDYEGEANYDGDMWIAAADYIEELVAQRDALAAQLPEGMKHCTIEFKECDKGHGWLTATNWVQHGCPTCENDTLAAKLAEVEKQEPVTHQYQTIDGGWHPFLDDRHYTNTVEDGRWPIRALYLSPGAQSQDTARYQWLCECKHVPWGTFLSPKELNENGIDAAIDSAMAQGAKQS